MAHRILASMIQIGFLCTPESLAIYPARNTESQRKRELLKTGEAEYVHQQSRFCFTLCREAELFEPKIRGLVHGESRPVREVAPDTSRSGSAWQPPMSHADLFGPYAISLDPMVSRRIGILPTTYYNPHAMSGERFLPGAVSPPGLGLQMIQSLKEVRDVLVALAILERSLPVKDGVLPSESVLRELSIGLPFEEVVVDRLYSLGAEARSQVYQLFDTDRVAALHLVGFVDMLLHTFQETDSDVHGQVLAFYEEREWRLIHHMRAGTHWFCLGPQPTFRSPNAAERRGEIGELRALLCAFSRQPLGDSFYRHCWVLEKVDGVPVRDLISSVIVPNRTLIDTRRLMKGLGCRAELVAAEEFGYREPR